MPAKRSDDAMTSTYGIAILLRDAFPYLERRYGITTRNIKSPHHPSDCTPHARLRSCRHFVTTLFNATTAAYYDSENAT